MSRPIVNRDPGDETDFVDPWSRLSAEMVKILHALIWVRFNYGDETGLQEGIQIALEEASIESEREVRLAPRDRIDFMVGRIGIEVKVAGSAERALSQLERYAESPDVDGLILVTTRAWGAIPDSVGGKPLETVYLALTQAL